MVSRYEKKINSDNTTYTLYGLFGEILTANFPIKTLNEYQVWASGDIDGDGTPEIVAAHRLEQGIASMRVERHAGESPVTSPGVV